MPASSETLTATISTAINHDDNLFRLAKDDVPMANGRGDTWRSMILGLDFKRSVSRQVFSGSAKFSPVKFDRNSQLDYLSKDLSGEWQWVLGARFEGHIGASYAQALASFADFHTDQRNLRITKKQYVDGKWRLHPSWQWRAGFTRDRFNYDLVSQRVNDRTEEALMTAIDYLAASGSTVGFQLRRLEGSYADRLSPGAGLLDKGYIQQEAKINVLWLAGGSTQVTFLGGWVQRKQTRTNNGTNARMIVDWVPVQRLKLSGQTWREFAAIEGALVNSALNTGATAGMTWDFSEKVQTVANVKHEKREFTPFNGSGASSALLSDSNKIASIGLVYKPLRRLIFKASVFRDRRSGSAAVGTNSYKANGGALSVGGQF